MGSTYRLIFRLFGWLCLGVSTLLFAAVWCAFPAKLDRLTVLTTMPVWLWALAGGIAGILAMLCLRKRFLLLAPLLWICMTLGVADEAKTLWNGDHETPLPGKPAEYEDRSVFRVITMNCAGFTQGNPVEDLARWQPDIVLLQDAYPHQVRLIANRLYGTAGFHSNCSRMTGVVSRWPIIRQIALIGTRSQQVTIRMPGPLDIDVVNLHLRSANTDLRFWKRSTWTNHRINQAGRLREIDLVKAALARNSAYPMTPVLLGGDFNAPATDLVHSRITDHFQDSFLQSGTGWGNTYHRRFPILRIDYLYHSFHFTSVRSRVVESAHSDHRMVVADYTIE